MAKRTKAPDLGFLVQETSHSDLAGMFAESAGAAEPITLVAPEHLLDNPYQPRKVTDPTGIAELADVIRAQGFTGVLEARPHPTRAGWYQLAWGHRRRDAAQAAGLATVPIMVRPLSEEEMVIRAITENIQRQDLTPLEEGDTYRLMIDELGYTQEQVAQEIGKDRGYVVNRLRVARAPADIRALVQTKPDSLRAVATLIKVGDPALRAELIAGLQTGRLTADDLPGYIAEAEDGPAQEPDTDPRGGGAEAVLPAEGGTRAEPDVSNRPADSPSAQAGDLAEDPTAAERVQIRLGKSKLSQVLRLLTLYRAGLAHRADISTRELVTLGDIKTLVDDLYDQYGGGSDLRR